MFNYHSLRTKDFNDGREANGMKYRIIYNGTTENLLVWKV